MKILITFILISGNIFAASNEVPDKSYLTIAGEYFDGKQKEVTSYLTTAREIFFGKPKELTPEETIKEFNKISKTVKGLSYMRRSMANQCRSEIRPARVAAKELNLNDADRSEYLYTYTSAKAPGCIEYIFTMKDNKMPEYKIADRSRVKGKPLAALKLVLHETFVQTYHDFQEWLIVKETWPINIFFRNS